MWTIQTNDMLLWIRDESTTKCLAPAATCIIETPGPKTAQRDNNLGLWVFLLTRYIVGSVTLRGLLNFVCTVCCVEGAFRVRSRYDHGV